jgi:hypothetical protein
MVLGRAGRQLNYLPAPDQPAGEFRFVIRDSDSPQPRLDLATGTDRAYAARRSADGVTVHTPSGADRTLQPGRSEEVLDGLELSYRDERPRARSARPAGGPGAGRARAAAGRPPDGSREAPSRARRGPEPEDDLL